MLQTLTYAALGTAFLFLMTTLGAATVFFLARESGERTQRVLLGFAAGAMIYVVVEELIPESQSGHHSNIATVGVAMGFALMMILDVALG